jgi:hypothetical protein
MGLFGLKIGWDVARAFLKEAALTVLPLDLLYSGGDGNHDVCSLFCHFDVFLLLTAILIKFVCMIDIVFSPSILSTSSFILADFWQPWRERRRKCAPPS